MHHSADTPVVFLDIDETIAFQRVKLALGSYIDPVSVALLRRILTETGAKIVVSSTWRSSHDQCATMFAAHGLTPFLWSPIDHPDGDWRVDDDNASRSSTISRWLAAHPMVHIWAILDDSISDLDRAQLDRLIHVDAMFGIGIREYKRAVRLLKGDALPDCDEGRPYQNARHTIAKLAADALAALDQGDEDAARKVLNIIAGHPLAQ